jgi:sugar phosphate isomerase/epimerase
LISGFSDEAAADKKIDGQFAVMAATGVRYVTIRFADCGGGPRNVLDLDSRELERLCEGLETYGLSVSSIGSPIGKVLIADVQDGSSNRYVPFETILNDMLPRDFGAARVLGPRLIRGFSFYPPRNGPIDPWLAQATDQIGQIAERCGREGLTFGLEVEANLIGHNGWILRDIHRQVSHPALVLVFDGGNLVCQNYSPAEIVEQFHAMLPGLGWMHVKDFRRAASDRDLPGKWVDEEHLDRFVPAGYGDAAWPEVFTALRPHLPVLVKRLQERGIDGFFVDLEPHLRGGGQFGGFSAADGMGIACRALCELLERAQVGFELRRWETGSPVAPPARRSP